MMKTIALALALSSAAAFSPTLNGWVPDSKAFCYGLPGALAPVGNFDPAGFAEGRTVDQVKMLREAEVTHGRVSMLAVVGFLTQENFHFLFVEPDKDIGPAIRHLDEVRAEVPIFFEILVLGIGFAEISRSLAGWTAPAGANPADGPLANLPEDTPFRRIVPCGNHVDGVEADATIQHGRRPEILIPRRPRGQVLPGGHWLRPGRPQALGSQGIR